MVLNDNSKKMILNIVNGFRNYPAYKAYEINSYCYDWRLGIQALSITKNGSPINLWLFYPGINGEIESIATYGSNLNGHLNAIRNTMTVFGLPVESISKDCGMEDFLDIIIAPYDETLSVKAKMLSRDEFESAGNNVKSSFLNFLPKMSAYKKHIQTAVLAVATQQELYDVRNSIFSQSLFCKLINIAQHVWAKDSKDIEYLYCAAMAVGTIIKEYEWGTQYVMPNGLYEIANQIWSK